MAGEEEANQAKPTEAAQPVPASTASDQTNNGQPTGEAGDRRKASRGDWK